MKKFQYHLRIFVLLGLALLVFDTNTGSRKRYKKTVKVKQKQETPSYDLLGSNIRTHIDIPQQTAQPTDIIPAPLPPKKTLDTELTARIDNPPLPYELANTNKNDLPNQVIEEKEEEEDVIELHFENADLVNFIKQIEDIFEVTFITNDAIQPLVKGRKQIKGNKISFKTHQPLSKKEVWNLFVTFLEIAGFAVIQQTDPKIYRVTTIETARKSPIPAFIGVDHQTLPETDELIRYVYFIENTNIDTLKTIIDPLRSSASSLVMLKEHKAFVLTDKAYNIKTLMKIVNELDKISIPESMSVLKLRNADAKQVAELYQSLLPKEETAPRFFSKKQPTSLYFPENTRIIAEPRTNALILLGPKDAIKKIEEFIVKNIDVELDQAYSPLHIHQLRYADAVTIAEIMNNVTQFGKDTDAGKAGGVRGIDQYMRPMAFVPEKETNRLIIKGYYEDYLKAKEIIETLDEAQPQVAIEVLILAVSINSRKSLGAQIRSKEPNTNKGLLGKNVTFQTSGLFGGSSKIVENTATTRGTERLLGNILNLVTAAGPGSTVLSFGKDIISGLSSVWGIFHILKTVTNAEILSNPFLIATNKTPAKVFLGEERRVVTAEAVGQQTVEAFGKDEAKLEVKITPQINSDGMIILDLEITINDFINSADPASAEKNIREIKTSTIVADREVLALGGLIRNKTTNNVSKTPLLGDVPILGWLFKNKQKTQDKENLLILISTRIIEPKSEKDVREFTNERVADYYGSLDEMYNPTERHDPIHSIFFQGAEQKTEKFVEDYLFERTKTKNKKNNRLRKRISKNKRKKQSEKSNKKPIQIEPSTETNNSEEPITVVQPKSNRLLEKIQRKKRTKLSLTDFLSDDKGARI